MLEVCFNDSVKGALVLAQHCKNNSIGGAVGVITNVRRPFSCFVKRKALKEYKKRQSQLQRQAVSLGGKREDVVGVSFGLSEGDIKTPVILEACPRREYIHSTFLFDRHNEREDSAEQAIADFWRGCIEDLEKLSSNPEKIRIWLDNTPDAQCGLLFVADLLKHNGTEIHIVELPERIKRDDNCVLEYRGWGEMEPQFFGTFLDRERILTQSEIEELSRQWQRLKEENAPLRVVESGEVVSADESYYDDLIRKEFPETACKVAEIIGRALAWQKILTGDVFIAKRIRHFIDNGELTVSGSTKDGFYGTVVSRGR